MGRSYKGRWYQRSRRTHFLTELRSSLPRNCPAKRQAVGLCLQAWWGRLSGAFLTPPLPGGVVLSPAWLFSGHCPQCLACPPPCTRACRALLPSITRACRGLPPLHAPGPAGVVCHPQYPGGLGLAMVWGRLVAEPGLGLPTAP